MKHLILLFHILTTLVSVSKSYAQTNLIPQDTMVYCNQDSAIIQLSSSYNLVTWEKLGSSGVILNNQLVVRESGYYQVAAADSTLGDTTICFSTSDVSMSAFVNVPTGYIITDVIAGYYGTPIANCSNPLPGTCHFDAKNIIKKGFIGKKSFQYYQGWHPDMCPGVVKSLYVKLRCMKYIQDSVYILFIKQPMSYTQISDTLICPSSNISLTLPDLICDTTFIPVDTLNLSITSNNDVNSISTKAGRLYQIKVSNAVSYGRGSGNQADGAYLNISASPIENITWRINGMQFGTLPDFRPIPNVYNSSHQYYFYLIGDGDPIVFRANDCCLGDNSGQFQFVLSEVIINDQCKLNYTWSNSTTGNSATLTPSNTPYIISLKKGSSICSVDTFYVTAQSSIDSQPQNQNAFISNSALFAIASSDPLATYQWQTDLGAGFQNLNSVGQYSGTNTDTLTVSNVSMSNNNQPFRCIINSGSCSDTSNVAVLTVKNNLVITTPPLNHSKCEGDTAYFTCSVTGTFDSLQWQQYSSGWSRIKGGLDTFYRIDSTAALMNGDSIRVIAYGPGGNDTSGAAVIQLRGFKPKVATNAITQPTSGQANGSVDLTISGYGSYLRYSRWTSKPGNNYPNAGDFDLSNAAEGIYYLMIVTKQGCVYYEGPFNLGPSR